MTARTASISKKGREAEVPALAPGVKITALDNGLTIIVREDHSAPVVYAQAWAMTGSIDEGKWLGAGMSHVLEHMLFKGTTTRGAGRIDQEVQDAGGFMKPHNSFGRTPYYIIIPKTAAEVAIPNFFCTLPKTPLPSQR